MLLRVKPLNLQQTRNIAKQKNRSWIPSLFGGGSKKAQDKDQGQVGYGHVVQVGDPVLRRVCQALDPQEVANGGAFDLLQNLRTVLRKYDSVGISAPQIGIPARVSLIEVTEKTLDLWGPKVVEQQQMQQVDLRVLINPEVKVEDNAVLRFREGCTSFNGFSAVVPRFKKVTVSYLDEFGEAATWTVDGWTARIVQHEVDHLDGKLYTDRMDAETLVFNYWKTVNKRRGDFKLGFGGVELRFSPFQPSQDV